MLRTIRSAMALHATDAILTVPEHECEADTYASRFGDVCCFVCHTVLRWEPALVREGLYGDETAVWVVTQARKHGLNPATSVITFLAAVSQA